MVATPTAGATLAAQVITAFPDQVARRRVLLAWGVPRRAIDAQIAAGRWRQLGQAVVLHSGPLTVHQKRSVALANVGGRALLTGFSSLTERGLTGWDRDAVHVLVPFGTRLHVVRGITVVRHRVADWDAAVGLSDGRRHAMSAAAALAADTLGDPRHAVGLLAAIVQQRLEVAASLRAEVDARPRHRHRRLLLAALADIEMGAEALSELDFAALCRSLRLPGPARQAFRCDAQGRKRYLDVEWILADGRRIVRDRRRPTPAGRHVLGGHVPSERGRAGSGLDGPQVPECRSPDQRSTSARPVAPRPAVSACAPGPTGAVRPRNPGASERL